MALAFTPLAEADLEAIGDYIALDSPHNALTFIAGLREHCERIGHDPLVYTARPELGKDLRSCPHDNYVIFFRPSDGDVLIVRILHGSRDLMPLLGESAK